MSEEGQERVFTFAAQTSLAKTRLFLKDWCINVSAITVYSYLVPVINDAVKRQSMDF